MRKISFIALLFLLLSPFAAKSQGKIIDRIIAIVGDKPILFSEMESQRLSAQSQGISLGLNARNLILDELLYQYLLLHHAELDSIEVTESQIQNELEGRIKYFEYQIGGRQKLEEFYGKSIAEIKDEFYDLIRDKLLIQAMERKITENIKVTPAEVRAFYAKIPKDSLPLISSQIEMAQITMIPKVTEAEKALVKELLEKLRKDIIEDKTSFCIAAFESDDKSSSVKCGDLGWVQRKMLVPEFDAMVPKLKDGEYSEVFETTYGYHFMQLISRRGDEYHARHILKTPKVTATTLLNTSKFLDSIYNQIKAGTITFEDAAKKFSDDEETKMNGGKMLNPRTGDTRFDVSELDPQLFITIDRLKVGEFTRPGNYSTEDNRQGYRMIKLLSRTDPHRANLHDDYQLIMLAAQNDKEEKAIEAWIRSKIPVTYIWIADDLKNYNYKYPWIKVQ
jgi:peptidyl-prolyl cis-trans isomerase SurA